MDQLFTLRKIALSLITVFGFIALPQSVFSQDCLDNDVCQTATPFPSVVPDESFVCITGCNYLSSPDAITSACQMGDFPTVWYRLEIDGYAAILNIDVSSNDFEAPIISLFEGTAGCDLLQHVDLSSSNMSCIIGSHGRASAIGTRINNGSIYYIAVSSFLSIGGDFELCVSAIANGSHCVTDRNLEVVARSNGGSLEGPFDPAEKITVCMNVNAYTAAGNGCQWFQGMIPVFGNGWDPSSFNQDAQPFGATINGEPIGAAGNGVYGASTWDWFADVGYHHDNPRYSIGDFDNNGRVEMCNSSYEKNCPLQGLDGGCCGPCWNDPGGHLPPGWFSYGINGSCDIPGPPISVDWGDGNTCGGSMGPWSFCFELTTRDIPDCLTDTTHRDLSLGFYTFADGEVGSWTGGESVCNFDQPVKVTLKAQCGRMIRREHETLPTIVSGDTLRIQVADPEVSHWEWNISPFNNVPYMTTSGPNGFMINAPVVNNTSEPVLISGFLIGYVTGSSDVIFRQFSFTLEPASTSIHHSADKAGMKIYPMPATDAFSLAWKSDMICEEVIITDVHGRTVFVRPVSPSENNLSSLMLDSQALQQGLFFISLTSKGSKYTAKLLKQ